MHGCFFPLFIPSWFFCGGPATLTVSKGTLEIFRGSKISTAAACCFWAWRYFSVVKSSTFMMTQRRVSSGSSADLASATTMAPRHPGHKEKTDVGGKRICYLLICLNTTPNVFECMEIYISCKYGPVRGFFLFKVFPATAVCSWVGIYRLFE